MLGRTRKDSRLGQETEDAHGDDNLGGGVREPGPPGPVTGRIGNERDADVDRTPSPQVDRSGGPMCRAGSSLKRKQILHRSRSCRRLRNVESRRARHEASHRTVTEPLGSNPIRSTRSDPAGSTHPPSDRIPPGEPRRTRLSPFLMISSGWGTVFADSGPPF